MEKGTMEKQLSVLGYWLGVISLALALVFRLCTVIGINPPHLGSASGNGISYMTFLHGAALFFLLSIASWCQKSGNS
jgi:hypothetical protein